MNSILAKIKKSIRLAKLRLPAPLPQTDLAVRAFAEDVCELGGFPVNDSMVQAVATQIMHVAQDATRVRKQQFVVAIKRAIMNQASFNVLQDIKERQNAKRQEAANETGIQNTAG